MTDCENVLNRMEVANGVAGPDAAVLIRNAYKEYKSTPPFLPFLPISTGPPNQVIKGLNMTVERGTIYGLLGASGCGKTTILKAIVGQDRLTSGEVWTLGQPPGAPGSGVPGAAIGYMPQEMALYAGFSIAETFRYFGWLTGIPRKALAERTAFLLRLLDLPPAHFKIGHLSGGQQRRVSFAITLLHEPPLLILDEPTVGVDPLLRQRIWAHLMDLTADGRTTVIITTHYIEEARQAHTLGLMRLGVLLAEDSPDRLLQRYQCASMEDVFLKLSVLQTRTAPENAAEIPAVTTPDQPASHLEVPPLVANHKAKEPFVRRHYRTSTATHMQCLLWKHCLWLWSNYLLIGFLIVLPVVQCFLFGSTVGRNPRGLKVAVANEEALGGCGEDVETLDTFNCGHPSLLSCRFLAMLKNMTFDTTMHGSAEEAQAAVRKGEAWAALHFGSNFTTNIFAKINEGRDATKETLIGSEMHVWQDNSNSYIGGQMQFDMTYGTVEYLKTTLAFCGYNPAIGGLPLKFEEPVYGVINIEFLTFAAPGFIVTTIFFMSLASAALSLLSDKREGLMDRSLVMGVTMWEVMWSHVIIHTVVMIIQTTIVLVSVLDVLQVSNHGSLFWLVLLCLLQGFCGICMGMVVSSVTDSDVTATFISVGAFFPFIALNGMLWPVEGMHFLLHYVWWTLPLSLATSSLRFMMARGWAPGLQHPQVAYGFFSTIFWIGVFLAAAMFLLRTNKR